MLGVLIDVDECIGCHACTIACNSTHNFPKGISAQRVISVEEGEFPSVKTLYAPVERCMHCLDPACVEACPIDALKFGDRDELIKEAKDKKKYVYGEVESGGTSVIYVSNEPLTKIGLPKLLPEELEILAINPEAQRAFTEFRSEVLKGGKILPAKVKRLLTIVTYAVSGCEECVEECMKEALSEGVKKEEILDALTVACLVKGGSALNICKRAFKALQEEN